MKIVAWIVVFELHYIILKWILFLQKVLWKLINVKECAITWKWPPLLVTSLYWSLHVDWKALVTSLVCFRIALRRCQVAVDFFCEYEFLYKGRNDVTISQTLRISYFCYLCPFVCNFAVKFALVVRVSAIVFSQLKVRCQFHPHSSFISPPKEIVPQLQRD